ncbi:unnamed protein product-related [Plasmodium yoelii yoelii]|uniref:Unnamed protein product-related n=1 Tax=Plasmodium yoelii yoelii TaxID=73239 RepID=Q7RQG7_PLAYO|nr:unnamed protein product-related [Plasmodium yoelii yoelii]
MDIHTAKIKWFPVRYNYIKKLSIYLHILILYKYINPEKNFVFDELKGYKKGIVGELDKLNHLNVSTQPIISFDWNKDKLGLCAFASLDQTIRVYIITKLNLC